MRILKSVITVTALVFLAGCSSTYNAKVNFDTNPAISTADYKTYVWLSDKHALAAPEDVNPITLVKISTAIEAELEKKGFTQITSETDADFAVAFTLGSRDKIKVTNFPVTYNHFDWGYGYYGDYHMGMSRVGTETRVTNYTEGKVAIDIYDVKSHQPAWHGWATKRLTSNDEKNETEVVNVVVAQVLANFAVTQQ